MKSKKLGAGAGPGAAEGKGGGTAGTAKGARVRKEAGTGIVAGAGAEGIEKG
jgi:hypothetical protein